MRWKAISAALLLFFAGVISGVMAQRLIASRTQLTSPNAKPNPTRAHMPWANQRMDFVQRLTRDLALTPEQAAQIDQIMKESQQRMRDLWEPVAPKAQEEMDRSRAAVDAVLTEEQRARMEELFKRRGPPGRDRPDFNRRGPGNEDRDGGPPGNRPWGGRPRGDRFENPPPPDGAPPEAAPPEGPLPPPSDDPPANDAPGSAK